MPEARSHVARSDGRTACGRPVFFPALKASATGGIQHQSLWLSVGRPTCRVCRRAFDRCVPL